MMDSTHADAPTDVTTDAAADVTTDAATQAAIAEVEEQMSVLAGHIRASIRDAALRVDPTLQPFGLKVLRMLARCGPLQAGSLADQMMVDRSVISRQARQLEELGLIELQADPADGRARIMALTPLATTRLHEVRVGNAARVHTRLRSWPVDDLHSFAALLARLNGPVEE